MKPALPKYHLMLLMLGLAATVAPASIDMYLPAFGALQQQFGHDDGWVQRSLGLYMAAYALMLLLHGTLSDALGRRSVLLTSLLLHATGSLLAATAQDASVFLAARILQGLSAGAGLVVGQAIVRDVYPDPQARRMLSWILMMFSISPALAPIIGGQLLVLHGWRAIFHTLALLALLTALVLARWLPETLPRPQRSAFSLRPLATALAAPMREPAFVRPGVAASLLVAAQGFLIGGAPDLITGALGLPETAFAALFIPLVVGAMAGAALSARWPARWPAPTLYRLAYACMAIGCLAEMLCLGLPGPPVVAWAVGLPALFTFGLALVTPALTVGALAASPGRVGAAASLFGFLQMLSFAAVAGWMVPWVNGHPVLLAAAMSACVLLGWAAARPLWRQAHARPPRQPS